VAVSFTAHFGTDAAREHQKRCRHVVDRVIGGVFLPLLRSGTRRKRAA
jgi:hypothetical protein